MTVVGLRRELAEELANGMCILRRPFETVPVGPLNVTVSFTTDRGAVVSKRDPHRVASRRRKSKQFSGP